MDAQAVAEARARLNRLRGYLQNDPGNAALARDAAALARELGDWQAERDILDAAVARAPTDELAFALGTNALRLRDYRKAVAIFESLHDSRNPHPAIRFNLGYAHFYAGAPSEAAKILETFSDSDWNDIPEAHKLYAQARHHLDEDLDVSISHLRQYLALRDTDAEAHGLLALVCYDDDRLAEASEAAAAALALVPNEPNALLALGGIALEQQEADTALAHFRGVLDLQPWNGRAWSGLAFAQLLKLDGVTARQSFEKAVEYMPDHIGTWHGLAWLQIMQNDLKGAEASLNRAMDLDRNFGDTHGSLAVIAVMRGQVDQAKLMIRRALGLNPQSFSGRYAQSLLLGSGGDRESAAKIVQTLLTSSVTPGAADVRSMAATLLAKNKRKGGG